MVSTDAVCAPSPLLIGSASFLRRWRPACDDAAQCLAADGRVLAAIITPLCPGLRFRDLHHSHKNMLVELEVPEVLQDDRLGHRPPGMHPVYAHTTPAMRDEMTYGLEWMWAGWGKRPGQTINDGE